MCYHADIMSDHTPTSTDDSSLAAPVDAPAAPPDPIAVLRASIAEKTAAHERRHADITAYAEKLVAKDAAAAAKHAELKDLKTQAVDVLASVLKDASSDDVKRKAAVDILSFTNNTKNEIIVTEEQLGWLGKVLIEAEEIRDSLAVRES